MTPTDLINRAMTTERPDLDALARELGIDVVTVDLHDNICGWLVPVPPGAVWQIVRNARHRPVQTRFTTAHMLGHFHHHRELLGNIGCNDGTNYRQVVGAPGRNPRLLERHDHQASRFAIRLIAPDAIIRRLLEQDLNVFQIASRLEAPVQAIKIRLDELNARR